MKIADYGKAITSYIESPTKAQKTKSKLRANLMEEYLGDKLDYQRAVDEGFQGTEEEYRRYKATPIEDRTFLANGSFDFSGMSVPQLRLLYRRYTGFDGPRDSRQLIRELKRLIKGLDEDGIPFSKGGRVHLANGSTPKAKPFTLDQFKEKANIYVGALQNNALPLADIKSALNKFTTQGIEDGTFTADEAIKVVKDLRSYYRDLAQKQRLRGVVEGIGEVERRDYQDGLSVQTLDPRFPVKDPVSTDFKPLDIPGAALPPLAIGAGIKRLKDTFFSKDKDDDKKEIVPSDDKNNLNLKRGDDPGDPDPIDDLANSLEVLEAVERLKKKEMNPDKRDERTKLAVDLDLPVTRSGLYEIRKDENYFSKRLQTLKDKGVNFDGYYNSREIANLLGLKTGSGVNDFITRKNVPKVKSGLFSVVKLNDFLDAYTPTKERIQRAPEEEIANKARNDFLKESGRSIYKRFIEMRQPIKLPENINKIYSKYDLGTIEGGHPFPIEFFTKKFGKGNTLQKDRQIDWIYRNKDKLFDKDDLVFQSKNVNKYFKGQIGELKKLYKELGPLVDKYEGKGRVTNQKDVNKIESLNKQIMDIVAKSEFDAKEFIKNSPDSVDLPRFRLGGLHGALFNTDTGEVSLYAPGKEAGFVKGAIGEEESDSKLKLAGDYLDIINQVITDEGDKKIFTDFIEQKILPRFQKGGPVYGKYAKQIAGLS